MSQQKLWSVGVGVLLVLGAVVGAGLSGAVVPADNPLQLDDDDEEEEEEEELTNVSDLAVNATEAIAIAENETEGTNATVVELELTTEDPEELPEENESETEDGNDTQADEQAEIPVWEVELVTEDGSEIEVLVDATEGSVLLTQTETAEDEGAENEEAENESETEESETGTDDADTGTEAEENETTTTTAAAE